MLRKVHKDSSTNKTNIIENGYCSSLEHRRTQHCLIKVVYNVYSGYGDLCKMSNESQDSGIAQVFDDIVCRFFVVVRQRREARLLVWSGSCLNLLLLIVVVTSLLLFKPCAPTSNTVLVFLRLGLFVDIYLGIVQFGLLLLSLTLWKEKCCDRTNSQMLSC